MRCVLIISSMILILVLSACAQQFYSYRTTAAEQRDPSPILTTDPNVGIWETLDVTVTYSFTRAENGIELSGRIDLNERFRYGHTDIEYFRLWISFLDAEGRTIEKTGLFSIGDQRLTERLYFGETIALPEKTEAISFGYAGQIRGRDAEIAFHGPRDSPNLYDPLGIISRRGADTVIHPASP